MQTEAEARAKEILGNLPGGGDAVVHGADGKIRAREKAIPSPRAERGEAPWAALAQDWVDAPFGWRRLWTGRDG